MSQTKWNSGQISDINTSRLTSGGNTKRPLYYDYSKMLSSRQNERKNMSIDRGSLNNSQNMNIITSLNYDYSEDKVKRNSKSKKMNF